MTGQSQEHFVFFFCVCVALFRFLLLPKLLGIKLDKTMTRYKYRELLSPPSVYFNRQSPWMGVASFSDRIASGSNNIGLREDGPGPFRTT